MTPTVLESENASILVISNLVSQPNPNRFHLLGSSNINLDLFRYCLESLKILKRESYDDDGNVRQSWDVLQPNWVFRSANL